MAKKKSHGIYVRTTRQQSKTPQTNEEMRKVLSRAVNSSPMESLLAWLKDVEASVAESLQQNVETEGDPPSPLRDGFALDLGQGLRGYVLAEALSDQDREIALDEIEALQQIRSLRISLSHQDAARIAIEAVKLSRVVERLKVRPLEKYLAVGLSSTSGGKLGHELAYGTDGEKQEKWTKRYAAYQRQIEAGAGAMKAMRLAGEDCHVSWKAIQRAREKFEK